jgi:hypothetical protein
MKRLADELMQSKTWLEKPRINDHMGNPIREVFLKMYPLIFLLTFIIKKRKHVILPIKCYGMVLGFFLASTLLSNFY